MNDQATIIDRLRSETRPHHDRLEEVAASDRLATGSLSADEYVKLLKANYVAHRQLENAVSSVASMQQLSEERQKLGLLEKDLQQSGVVPQSVWEQFNGQLPAPQFNSHHQALGAQYVMEGATLGGVVILKSLQQHPQLQQYQPFHYYGCYGGDTGRQWSGFKKHLLEQAQTTQQQEQVLEGARTAYELFEKAFLAVQV